MLLKTGQEFQCLKGYGKNTNVLTDRTGIPVFMKNRARIPMFERVGLEWQCLIE